jgi:hypothetical protein
MTIEDREQLKRIIDTTDDRARLSRIATYWTDGERADRTPREYLVLHLGIVVGICERLLAEHADPRRI